VGAIVGGRVIVGLSVIVGVSVNVGVKVADAVIVAVIVGVNVAVAGAVNVGVGVKTRFRLHPVHSPTRPKSTNKRTVKDPIFTHPRMTNTVIIAEIQLKIGEAISPT
jgi:hypothetical protein